MKHPSSRQLYEYWIERRGPRAAPERSDIEPAAIRGLLADCFMLSGEAERRFRIAGTKLCALFGRELRGAPFLSIWDGASTALVRELLAGVAEEEAGIVAGAWVEGPAGPRISFELVLLPLIHRQRIGGRMLGMLAPRERPYWTGIWPAAPLRLTTFGYLIHEAGAAPGLLPGTPAARRPHRLTVIDGGRS